ncbi:hypothetical protein V6N00_10900 [Tersicoccus sp. MR15.9]|uniref:hypothetical protein n=1 Tax=Tersicoccus mangrovi TaxID=3121635 RepID=UPI002FE62D1D
MTTNNFVELDGQPFRAIRIKRQEQFVLWWDDEQPPGPGWEPFTPGVGALPVWRRDVDAKDVGAYFAHVLSAVLDGYRFQVSAFYVAEGTVDLRGGSPPTGSAGRGMYPQIDLLNHPYVEPQEGGSYFTGEVPLEELSDFVSERYELPV